jgi:hypothetical protein
MNLDLDPEGAQARAWLRYVLAVVIMNLAVVILHSRFPHAMGQLPSAMKSAWTVWAAVSAALERVSLISRWIFILR